MNTIWLQNCFIMCSIFCLLCPKRTIQSESKESYEKTLYIGKSLSSISEPGFNLTEEEMEKFKIWPNGIIPYFIDEYSFDPSLRNRLRSHLESYNDVTGLGFLELDRPPQDDDQRWVFFVNRRGVLACEDYTTESFTNTGVQKVVLGYDCLNNGGAGGSLAATILALAGVPPQHNAPDRVHNIEVKMENIIPQKQQLFEALKNDEWLFHLVPYDFLSAGHYDFHKYSVNGQATIVPQVELKAIPIGEEDGLSSRDILKIKMLYNFISLNRKNAKSSDCSLLFKPGNRLNESDQMYSGTMKRIKPRNKPDKYLGIIVIESDNPDTQEKSDSPEPEEDDNDVNNNYKKKHRSLKKFKSMKSKDFLGLLSDRDTDADRNRIRKRKTKGRHMLKAISFDRGEQKNRIAELSDYDSDKANKKDKKD